MARLARPSGRQVFFSTREVVEQDDDWDDEIQEIEDLREVAAVNEPAPIQEVINIDDENDSPRIRRFQQQVINESDSEIANIGYAF